MKLSAFPKCYMDELVIHRTMSVFDWIEMAAELPVDGMELYDGFLTSLENTYLDKVRAAIERHQMVMPMLCYSPDFTKPNPEERRQEIERQKKMIDVTARLGGKYCRVLSGQRRPEVTRQQGIQYVADSIKACLDHAASRGIVLAMENHYKDNYWKYPEFAQRSDVFLDIINQIDSPWFGVQYDPSNATMAGEDPVEVLQKLKHRVVTMHASDRYLIPGHSLEELKTMEDSLGYATILSHGVIGQGLNDYQRIFEILREVGFQGWISIEDGVNGMDELRASAEFLRKMMEG